MPGGEGEGPARRLADRSYPVAGGLAQVGGGVDVVGAAGERPPVELAVWAAAGGAFDVEADAFGVEPEQPPAHQHLLLARAHGHHTAVEPLHEPRARPAVIRPAVTRPAVTHPAVTHPAVTHPAVGGG
ncbi:hypothetical protein FXF51_41495 [Nonomuraea sp. PA05]|nr:hypothetical protein FXF51_41495 [Nonomuraea sp. PA05]